MALLNIGDDPWILEYDSCEKLQRDIMEKLMERQKEPRTTENYSRMSATIRIRLKQYNLEVTQLQEKLDKSIGTYDERERRSQQVEVLKSKGIQMDKMFNEVSTTLRDNRIGLFGPGEGGSASAWLDDDDEILMGDGKLSVDDIKKQKQRMLREQEEGLDNLAKIIARQKNIASTISAEVDLHNDIIEDLGDQMDRTDSRVTTETRNVTVIDRKDKTCIYWVIIILLLISIIVVGAI